MTVEQQRDYWLIRNLAEPWELMSRQHGAYQLYSKTFSAFGPAAGSQSARRQTLNHKRHMMKNVMVLLAVTTKHAFVKNAETSFILGMITID